MKKISLFAEYIPVLGCQGVGIFVSFGEHDIRSLLIDPQFFCISLSSSAPDDVLQDQISNLKLLRLTFL